MYLVCFTFDYVWARKLRRDGWGESKLTYEDLPAVPTDLGSGSIAIAERSNSGELMQGTLDMLILKTLARGAMHGYAIVEHIQSRSEEVLRVEEGALYPALHRLELRGLLAAEWGHPITTAAPSITG